MTLRGRKAADYGTLAESIALAVAIELGLRLVSMSSLLRLIDRLGPATLWCSGPSYPLDRFAAAPYRLLPIRSTCLRESLVLYGLLRRRGAMPKLCVGVKKDGHGLAAHAWIECAGEVRVEPGAFVELRQPQHPETGREGRKLAFRDVADERPIVVGRGR
jgi:hypothetical protein